MKTIIILTAFAGMAAAVLAAPGTNTAAALVERGLFEEEANHQYDAAISDYVEAIAQFDHERQLAATAIFHLGECYRKEGKTNEAAAQYQRIAREFPEQAALVQASQAYVPAAAALQPSRLPPDEEKFLLQVKESAQNSPDLMNEHLHEAAENGYVSAAEYLLAHGAEVDRGAPISTAAQIGNLRMVELLLSHGANIDSVGGDGFSALGEAANKGFKALCQALLAHGADINAKARGGRTPLQIAVDANQIEIAGLLLSNKADANAKEDGGVTALARACALEELAIVRLLLDNHADANLNVRAGGIVPASTPLACALNGNPEIVKLLLEAHADPNAEYFTQYRPGVRYPLLDAAALDAHSAEIAGLLLEHGAKPNIQGLDGITPLDNAIRADNLDAVRLLIEHGADVNILNQEGGTPLVYLRHARVPNPRPGSDFPLTKTAEKIRAMLIQAGADVDYNRRRFIWTSDISGAPQRVIFRCPGNSINHYTLLDFIGDIYDLWSYHWQPQLPFMPGREKEQNRHVSWNGGGGPPFPHFGGVLIHRLEGTREIALPVNLAHFFSTGDCAENAALQPGDVIEIPEHEHKTADAWHGLTDEEVTNLNICLTRVVRIVVKGTTNVIALVQSPQLATEQSYAEIIDPVQGSRSAWLTNALHGRKADLVVGSFILSEVVRRGNVLLNTSDLSRVRLTRGGTNFIFNLTTNSPACAWLEDGDLIEIPDLGESAAAKP
ncbi:MAG TPA: ankyrin repeat domain-containing protein [Verrucomicrobiae bacterium]|jgi:ankyrin repeat protein